MKQYFTGLITGILFTTSIIMFIGARTVNVTKKKRAINAKPAAFGAIEK